MSKVRINELYDALDKREAVGKAPDVYATDPDARRARIRSLATIHLGSMEPEEFAAVMADVQSIRAGGEASKLDNAKKAEEAADRAAKVGQDAPSF